MQRPARLPVLIALASLASPAVADDATEAKELFEQGREHVKAGHNSEACPYFEKSLKFAPALGTKLNLAICWAATGKLTAAQALFETIASEATDPSQAKRLVIARAALEELAGRVPHLAIDASGLPAGTAVAVDGQAVELGHPLAVDPGHHAVTAPAAKPVEVEVVEGRNVEIRLEPIAIVKPSTARPRQIWIVGGAAAGALVITAIAGIAVLNERGNANHHCSTTLDDTLACDQRGLDLLDRAHTMQHVSTGFFVAGAALTAMSAILEVKWRRSTESPVATGWSAPHALGVALEGHW